MLRSFGTSFSGDVTEMTKRHSGIFTFVDSLMTWSTEGNLFSVNSSHHFTEGTGATIPRLQMFEMMHFHSLGSPAVCAALAKSSDGRNFPVLNYQGVLMKVSSLEVHGCSSKGRTFEVKTYFRTVLLDDKESYIWAVSYETFSNTNVQFLTDSSL